MLTPNPPIRPMFNDHLDTFFGLPVHTWTPGDTLTQPASFAYALHLSWDDERVTAEDLFASLIAAPGHEDIRALVLGMNDLEEYDDMVESHIARLTAARDALPNLKALFLPDVVYEECEVSWIQQSNVTPILEAWPALEELHLRGGIGLRFDPIQHSGLRKLVIQAGGIPAETVRDICAMSLPNLEHLELWLGTPDYEGDSTLEDLAPILSGKLFPKLRHLALCNSVIADGIARALVGAPVLEQVEVLDVSKGTLSEEGAEALLSNPALSALKALDVSENFLSEATYARFSALPIPVTVGTEKDLNDDWRYCTVSE